MKEKTWDIEWTKIANIAKKEEEGSGQVETREEGIKIKRRSEKTVSNSRKRHMCAFVPEQGVFERDKATGQETTVES